MPTKLGIILRGHELQLGVPGIERYVQDQFDELPSSLQVAHDEERPPLDLYATLVFLVPLVGLVAVPISPSRVPYLIAVEGIIVLVTLLASSHGSGGSADCRGGSSYANRVATVALAGPDTETTMA